MIAQPKLLVCGSINMDWVLRVAQLPIPGQTRLADSMTEVPGGKGANQAIAAARLGASVRMIGRIGSDAIGERLKDNLRQEGIVVDSVARSPGSSGIAIVSVEDSGENSIVLVPGVNATLTPEDIDRASDAFAECDWVILQLEIPLETVEHAMFVAKRYGKRIILNPAPAPEKPSEFLLQADVLCPNQSEAETILGLSIGSHGDAIEAARQLSRRGARNVVITLGDAGSVAFDGQRATIIPAHQVDVIDTTAAGDAFIGALGFQLGLGKELVESCRFATAAAAHAVTIAGAQPSLPRLKEVEDRLNQGLQESNP